MPGAQKNCLHFITRTKWAVRLIMDCICCVIQSMVDSPPPFPDSYKNIPGCKKLPMYRHLHKTDPKFNYKLYFIQNSHYDVMFTQ